MPNWVTNKLTADKEVLDELMTKEEDHEVFDFNKVVPMPEIVRNTGSGFQRFTIDGVDHDCSSWYRDPETSKDRPFNEEERKELINIGYSNWYDWSLCYWGCKWNASQTTRIDDNSVEFDTPWSTPNGIWEALAEKYPDKEFSIEYADEDIGSNVGRIEIAGGELSYEELSDTKEGYELAFMLRGGEDDYTWNEKDERYEYNDDEEE